jgi:carbamate kinase
MRILIALGGNALLRRGEPMTMSHQIVNIRRAAQQIATSWSSRMATALRSACWHYRPPPVARLVRRRSMYSTPSRKA